MGKQQPQKHQDTSQKLPESQHTTPTQGNPKPGELIHNSIKKLLEELLQLLSTAQVGTTEHFQTTNSDVR